MVTFLEVVLPIKLVSISRFHVEFDWLELLLDKDL